VGPPDTAEVQQSAEVTQAYSPPPQLQAQTPEMQYWLQQSVVSVAVVQDARPVWPHWALPLELLPLEDPEELPPDELTPLEVPPVELPSVDELLLPLEPLDEDPLLALAEEEVPELPELLPAAVAQWPLPSQVCPVTQTVAESRQLAMQSPVGPQTSEVPPSGLHAAS
jgi:hypothetical protein